MKMKLLKLTIPFLAARNSRLRNHINKDNSTVTTLKVTLFGYNQIEINGRIHICEESSVWKQVKRTEERIIL